MNLVSTIIVRLILVLVIALNPLLASAAHAAVSGPHAAMFGATSHDPSEGDHADAHEHYPAISANSTAPSTSDLAGPPTKHDQACHPCCVTGFGPCFMLLSDAPNIFGIVPTIIHGADRLDAVMPWQVSPLLRPPATSA